MAASPGTCPKCGGKMSQGFIADFTEGVRRVPARWVSGPVEATPLTGTKMGDRDTRRVDADRCEGCGFLELYGRVQMPGGLFP